MSNITPDYIVRESSIPAQLAAAGRILTILIAGFGALMQFLTARDIAGAYVWIRTTDGAGFIAALVAAGTFAWSLYKTYQRHRRTVALASYVPDTIAQVK